MKFSIAIPSYNNLPYLKICLNSLAKNSSFKHEIIVYVNGSTDGTLEFVKNQNIKHLFSKTNVGICSSVNAALSQADTDFFIYAHDDMYFCPGWDVVLADEVKRIGHHHYFLGGTIIEPRSGHIQLDCGDSNQTFNEAKLLRHFNDISYHDHQGTHWAPHLIHRSLWEKVGGLSEEFNPGDGSDPDLNMKLWQAGIRIFKGLSACRVYHFGSVTLRRIVRNNGPKLFLQKWGMGMWFFRKYYMNALGSKKGVLRSHPYLGPLEEPKQSLSYCTELFFCKLQKAYWGRQSFGAGDRT